jgi:hypothetical protein
MLIPDPAVVEQLGDIYRKGSLNGPLTKVCYHFLRFVIVDENPFRYTKKNSYVPTI